MNLLLLSGNSNRSKEWLEQVDANLAPQFDKTHRHDYAHWENNQPEIDLELETERLATSVKEFSPYMIFAKSAGTILASKTMARNILQPKACLFVGLPLAMIQNHNLPADEWLQAIDIPITILQHTADPLGSYQDARQYIKAAGKSNITLHELPGDTHDYLEFQAFKAFIEKLQKAIASTLENLCYH